MNVIVKSIFRDKYTKETYKLNQTLNIDDKRYEEIKEFVEVVNETNNKNNTNKAVEKSNN